MTDGHQLGCSRPVAERPYGLQTVAAWPKPLVAALCVGLVLGIGVLDYVTGQQASVTVVYLLPIALGTWVISREVGIALAVESVLVWLVVERIQGVPYAHPLIQCWNALALLIAFMIVVFLLAGLNRFQEQLEEKVVQRTAELSQSRENLMHALADLQKSHARLRDTQLQLIQAEKMESVGRLAAGVAHEVKNPLLTILLGVEYLERLPTAQEHDVRDVLHDQKDAVERATTVINELLDFAAPSELHTQPEDLNAVIERALGLVRHAVTEARVTVARELEPGLPGVPLDRKKIEQVFVNALMNAIHAMPGGGTLTVRTYSALGAAAAAPAAPGPVLDGVAVTAEIDDTGTGIREEHLAKVFDPFFTTQPPGKGTGLGLSVVHQIVQMHGGTVDLSNRPEGGARFRLQLFKKGAGTSC